MASRQKRDPDLRTRSCLAAWMYYSTRSPTNERVMWRVSIDGGTPEQLIRKDSSPAILPPRSATATYSESFVHDQNLAPHRNLR